MSYNITPFNNTYTMENSQMSHLEDKLHLPTWDISHKDPEYTVINIVGYVNHIEQDDQDDFTNVGKPTHSILPLTIQDLRQDRSKKNTKQSTPLVITNFIENLISTNQQNELSNGILSSFKTLKELFSNQNLYEEKQSQINNFLIDEQDYCDAV